MYRNFERLRCNSGDIIAGLKIPTSSIASYKSIGELHDYLMDNTPGKSWDLISTNVCSDMLLVSSTAKSALEDFGYCRFEMVRFTPEADAEYWLILPELIYPEWDNFVFSHNYDSIPFDPKMGRYGWNSNAPFLIEGGRIESSQLFV